MAHDVFGKSLLAFQEGNTTAMMHIYLDGEEDDAVPVATFFRSEENMPEAEKLALSLCRGRILDIGAAAGCHALVLQSRGMEVTALDVSEGACKVMKERGVKNIICKDVFDFEDQEGFDVILLLMNGLGIAGSLAKSKELLDHLRRLLRPGGKVLTDSSDLIYLYTDEDGSMTLPMDKYYGEVVFQIEFNGERSEPFDWVYVDPDMMFELAENSGWEAELVYSGEHFDYLASLSPSGSGRA